MHPARTLAIDLLSVWAGIVSGCASDARISIDLHTDLVAGEEFDAVEIRIAGRAHEFPVMPGQTFLPTARRFGPVRQGCDPNVDPDVPACTSAADVVCRAHGFEAGWGPLEWNPTTAHLLCLRG